MLARPRGFHHGVHTHRQMWPRFESLWWPIGQIYGRPLWNLDQGLRLPGEIPGGRPTSVGFPFIMVVVVVVVVAEKNKYRTLKGWRKIAGLGDCLGRLCALYRANP